MNSKIPFYTIDAWKDFLNYPVVRKYIKSFRDEKINMVADQGLAEGQCAVALYSRFSQKDETEATKWFLLAAEQGHEFSMNEIAYCYRNGIGVEKNELKAKEWYQRLEDFKKEVINKSR